MTALIALVVAAGSNGCIGIANRLPWRLPGDLRHFRQVTLGKPVVMGRKTFESIGRPLPGRHNLVVTRDLGWRAAGVEVVMSLEVALARARVLAEAAGSGEVAVIGGAEIYAQVRPLADLMYLTRVELAPEGDAFFELPAPSEWVCEESIPEDEGGVVYRLERYRRRRRAA